MKVYLKIEWSVFDVDIYWHLFVLFVASVFEQAFFDLLKSI